MSNHTTPLSREVEADGALTAEDDLSAGMMR